MNRYEKIAWFNLAVETISLITYGIIFLLLMGKIGAARASFVALSSFSLIGFMAIFPQFFKHQDLERKVPGKRLNVNHISYSKIVVAAVLLIIFIASVYLYAILLDVPAGNDPIHLSITVLKIILSIFLISFVVMAILYLKKQRRFSNTSDNVDTCDSSEYFWFRESDMDERDIAIQRTAFLFVFRVFCVVYVLGFLVAWFWIVNRGEETVTIDISLLPALYSVPVLMILMAYSIVTILLYRQGK